LNSDWSLAFVIVEPRDKNKHCVCVCVCVYVCVHQWNVVAKLHIVLPYCSSR
jgi:hypothetical protein